MGEPIQTTVDTVAKAANTFIDQGVLGALVIILLAIVAGMAWMQLRLRNRYIKHLEDEADE